MLLRDWLRADPAGVEEYAQLKHQDYAGAKTPFVSNALDRAEQWALRTGWRVA
jgi:GrpB-like predicted nucleotidyltransferase (UPF0157 family)